jgi:serine O-acetyltransferase
MNLGWFYCLAYILYDLEVPLIPRIMTEYAHNITGIDIHPGAVIGHHFFIDHGTGMSLGGNHGYREPCEDLPGGYVGRAFHPRGGQTLKGAKRYPSIEDHVTIYSGVSIFGGNTVIGEGVVIGSNAFVTKSVPEKTRVSIKNPERQFKSDDHALPTQTELGQEEFWDWVI